MARNRSRLAPPVDDPSTPDIDESLVVDQQHIHYVDAENDFYEPQEGKNSICRTCGKVYTYEEWYAQWERDDLDGVDFLPCLQCGKTPVTTEGDPKYVWDQSAPAPLAAPEPEWTPDVMVCAVCANAHLPAEWSAKLKARPVGDHSLPGCTKCGSTDVHPATPDAPPPPTGEEGGAGEGEGEGAPTS